jgi:hypothetical protein
VAFDEPQRRCGIVLSEGLVLSESGQFGVAPYSDMSLLGEP